MFPKLNPHLPLPKFDHLTLEDGTLVDTSLEQILSPEEKYRKIREYRLAFEQSIDDLVSTTLSDGGLPKADRLQSVTDASTAYLPLRADALTREECTTLIEGYSRSEYDITPPRHPSKHNLDNPLGVYTSAMWDIFPGSDQEHRVLLRKHRAHMHFARRVAALGAVFVTPPNYDADFDSSDKKNHLSRLREVTDTMLSADPYWHVPPRFYEDTTVQTAKRVFEHYEDDWPGTVEDEGGRVIGVVDKEILARMRDNEPIRTCLDKDVPWAQDSNMTHDQAYDWMVKAGKKYVLRHREGRDPEVITRSSAVFSSLLPPFKYKDGLGFLVYLSVSSPERTLKVLDELDRDGRLPGVIIDPAHGNTGSMEVLLKTVREKHPDLFLAAGNYNNPKAPAILKDTIDMIKSPIGLGGVCDTYRTGVKIPDAYALMRLCVGAYEAGVPVLGDGLGGEREAKDRFKDMQMDDTSEWNIKWALPGIAGQQGGGFHIGRLTSCNPVVEHLGMRGRWASGEASNKANMRNDRSNGNISAQRARDAGLRYSEGVEDKFYWIRNPEHLSGAYYLLASRLRSAMSYVFSRKFPAESMKPGETLRLFQNTATILHKG